LCKISLSGANESDCGKKCLDSGARTLQHGLGAETGIWNVVSSFAKIATAVNRMLDANAYRGFRERAAADRNRAVFEIPDLLAKILRQSPGRQSGTMPADLVSPERTTPVSA